MGTDYQTKTQVEFTLNLKQLMLDCYFELKNSEDKDKKSPDLLFSLSYSLWSMAQRLHSSIVLGLKKKNKEDYIKLIQSINDMVSKVDLIVKMSRQKAS